jgi:ABC-type multidrug transport system ATPase subunit
VDLVLEKINKNQQSIQCKYCHQWIHKGCDGVDSDIIKIFDKNQNLRWFCSNCLVKVDTLLDRVTLLEEKQLTTDNTLQDLQNRLVDIEKNSKNPTTENLQTVDNSCQSEVGVNQLSIVRELSLVEKKRRNIVLRVPTDMDEETGEALGETVNDRLTTIIQQFYDDFEIGEIDSSWPPWKTTRCKQYRSQQ